jgi:hypothetical protein
MKLSPFSSSKPLRRQLSHEMLALLMACMVAATQLTACKSAPVPQHARQSGMPATIQAAPQPTRVVARSPTFTAQRMLPNGLGEPVLLRPGATTDLILSATWCPACMEMDRVLRDPALAPYLKGRTLAFLFVNEHQLAEPHEGSETGGDQGGLHPYVLHPETIGSLPGPAYLWTDWPSGHMQFPTILTANGRMSEIDWLTKRLGVPQETLVLAFSRASASRS